MLRAIKYGDGFFETAYADTRGIRLWPNHLRRLNAAARLLGLRLNAAELKLALDEACESFFLKNAVHSAVRLRLTVARSGAGLYRPETDELEFTIEVSPVRLRAYAERTWLIHHWLFLAATPLSNIKSINSLPYVLAAKYADEQGKEDCILLNHFGRVAEAVSGNVFCLTPSGILITPALSEGCIAGVMRQFILDNAFEFGIKVQESELTVQALQDAHFICTTNAIHGAMPLKTPTEKKVGQLLGREFCQKLHDMLANDRCF